MPAALTSQLELTSTTLCAITLQELADGECFPWIDVHGSLRFVSFDAYQRICRSQRDPTVSELVGAVRFRLCLEKLWLELVRNKNDFASDFENVAIAKLLRNLDVNTVACRTFLRTRFQLATGVGVGSGAVGAVGAAAARQPVVRDARQALQGMRRSGGGMIHNDPTDQHYGAFFTFAHSVETSRKHCVLVWAKTVRERMTLGDQAPAAGGGFTSGPHKRKRDDGDEGGGAAGSRSTSSSSHAFNNNSRIPTKRMRR